jgi:hypothetical protein
MYSGEADVVEKHKAPEFRGLCAFKLSCQGSNLDSSDPESDVLPITLQDKMVRKNNIFLMNVNPGQH